GPDVSDPAGAARSAVAAAATTAAAATPRSAVSAAAATPRLSSAGTQVVEQVAARLAGAPRGGSVVVPLDPPDLGEVLARFTRRGEELKIDLVARTPEAAEALRRELPQLAAALSRDDAKAQVSVHVGGDDARQQAGQQSTFSAQSDERRGGARHDARPTAALPFSGAADDPAPEAARVLAAPASALGRLDALA
ncbi:MAG: flagellar hook-length control protein FliK, partial [Candidatus Polarisedimenticolia bacterium]